MSLLASKLAIRKVRMYNTKQQDAQIEWVKRSYKPTVEEAQKENIATPQYLNFFDEDGTEPKAVLCLPPFENDRHKTVLFQAAFSAYRIFKSDSMILSNDVWMNGMEPDEYQEWMKQGKSLSENPKSKSAVMITFMTKDNHVMEIIEYKRMDNGEIQFQETERHENVQETGGRIPELSTFVMNQETTSLDNLDESELHDYFENITGLDIIVAMSEETAEELGLEDSIS